MLEVVLLATVLVETVLVETVLLEVVVPTHQLDPSPQWRLNGEDEGVHPTDEHTTSE
jgi:hypothetical protein